MADPPGEDADNYDLELQDSQVRVLPPMALLVTAWARVSTAKRLPFACRVTWFPACLKSIASEKPNRGRILVLAGCILPAHHAAHLRRHTHVQGQAIAGIRPRRQRLQRLVVAQL